MVKITPEEKKWIFYFAISIVIITTIPYFIAFQTAVNSSQNGSGWKFSGFLFGIEDGNSYIAKMRLGYIGNWLFRSPYTDMNQSGFLAFFPYLLLGKLVGKPALHEQLLVLFHLFRVISDFVVILATYQLISIFISSIYWRRIGLVIATVGGGLGWLSLIYNPAVLPLEFYSPESFGFLEIYGLPHLSLGRALMFWALITYLELWIRQDHQSRSFLKLSLLWFCAGLAQPLLIGLIGLIIGLHWLVGCIVEKFHFQDNSPFHNYRLVFPRILAASLLPALFLIYNIIKFSSDPYLAYWNRQNYLPSPQARVYLLSYGFFLPFAIYGGIKVWQKDSLKGGLLIPWLIVAPFLIYMPVGVQRRMIEGAWIALIILVTYGFTHIIGKYSPRYWRVWVSIGLGFTMVSSLILLVGGIKLAIKPSLPVFLPNSMVTMMETLDNISGTGNPVVLAAYETSNALPAYANVRVIIGHGPESAGGEITKKKAEAIYQSSISDGERLQFLKNHQVRFVVWGELERKLGNWNPASANYLKKISQSGDYFIYEVEETQPRY